MEELVLAGRREQEEELIRRLTGTPSTFTVRGDSPREAWGFTLAALRRAGSVEDRQKINTRLIVAENEEIAGPLYLRENLIIILKRAHGQVSGFLSSHGCHVVVPEGNDARSERNVIVLSRPPHRLFVEALGNMNFSEDDAEQAARACGLSITILQRLRAHANSEHPRWATSPGAAHLIPALLAGRWDNTNEADRVIICHLAGTSDYVQIESQLQEFLWVDEPPLQKLGEMWTLTAPVDAFQLLARRLTAETLGTF